MSIYILYAYLFISCMHVYLYLVYVSIYILYACLFISCIQCTCLITNHGGVMVGVLRGGSRNCGQGGVSRRGVWGPRPQRFQGRALVGAHGAKPPGSYGVGGITDIYLNDNFEPTTPFLSDQKKFTLSLNFVR